MDAVPLVYRRDLTYPVNQSERGKPVYFPVKLGRHLAINVQHYVGMGGWRKQKLYCNDKDISKC
jgi:hypothetical protein